MTTSQKIKILLYSLIFGSNLFFAVCLWLCGQSGNIMLGILAICFYRLSLWLSPLAVTVVCWLPIKPRLPASKKLINNLVLLLLCGALFLTCFLLFGNWY